MTHRTTDPIQLVDGAFACSTAVAASMLMAALVVRLALGAPAPLINRVRDCILRAREQTRRQGVHAGKPTLREGWAALRGWSQHNGDLRELCGRVASLLRQPSPAMQQVSRTAAALLAQPV